MNSATLFRLLGDEVRLRLLRLLDAERLNVTELTGILRLAQSGVSRHLGLLKDAGLVEEHRDGGFTYFRVSHALRASEGRREPPPSGGPSAQRGGEDRGDLPSGVIEDANKGLAPLWPLLRAQFAEAASSVQGRADDARLEEVRRLRKENFEEHGDPDVEGRQLVPGRSWAAWARALGHLLPPLTVADLGCGEGYLTVEAARFAREVIAVDRSGPVIARAKALAHRRRVSNISWRRGELEKLPIDSSSVDVALLSQALHHADHPVKAIAEAVRIVKSGGRVLVLDLRSHDQQWVRETLGDRWLGFDDDELRDLLTEAGLDDVRVAVGARRARDPFTVLIASGLKKAKRHAK